jgi:transcription initiation factor TFIIB
LLYQRFGKDKTLRTKRLDAVIAACIFIACRAESVPRTFKEVASFNKAPKRQVADCYKALKVALNVAPDEAIAMAEPAAAAAGSATSSDTKIVPAQTFEPHSNSHGVIKMDAGNWTNLLRQYCKSLQLPTRSSRDCEDISSQVQRLNIASGRPPASVAGGIIYFAITLRGYDISLSKVEQKTGVASETILSVHRLLMAKRAALVGPEAENFSSMKRRNEKSSKRLTIRVP